MTSAMRLETPSPPAPDAPTAIPAAPRRIRIGMPHLDASGLSEAWLYRYAGDLHWEAIGRQLGVSARAFRGESGARIYPTVVALRARFRAPLSAASEDDVLEARVEVVPCGRACAHGRIALVGNSVGNAQGVSLGISLELLTTFALREPGGALRMAHPAPELAARWQTAEKTPTIARLAKAARRGEPLEDPFCGPTAVADRPPLGSLEYEPSPYADYNGAGLLYFAAYPTIADTAERKLVHRLGLSPSRRGRSSLPGPSPSREVRNPSEGSELADWAVATSVVRRDVFYYANLPLGETLTAELVDFVLEGAAARAGVKTRVRLRRASDGEPMADLVTRRLFVEAPPP